MKSPLTFDPRALSNAGTPDDKGCYAEWPQFCAWFEKVREDHEFSDVAHLLAAATHDEDPKVRTTSQCFILWNCWRAASWRPDPFFEERAFADELLQSCVQLIGGQEYPASEAGLLPSMARAIERSGVAGQHFNEHVTAAELRDLRERLARAVEALLPEVAHLERWQHGPLFFLGRDGKEGITRLPNAATMLAAQIAAFLQQNGRDVRSKWRLITMLVAISGLGDDVSEESLRVRAGKVLDLAAEGRVNFVPWPADVGATFADMERLIEIVRNDSKAEQR